ncbi:hypothetical protein LOTGIDRAFT_158398 [Lottia gigantea]|uniref:Uncharacterized protein n=1 Tax=Lottia gigantea TaxID=225164 RepID=V4AQ13_LOTGI|nr:hypothetical protein LOTGIDRAFT_158398 [Lottia gigantea]ESO99317.1 hypothetical protein LOTGIDRAFT_158398 [Lottia gigantea]
MLQNDADLARVRVVARNTIERVARAANQGFEKPVNQYNLRITGLPYKIHLQREINDDKIFFGENASVAKLEITNLQLYIPVITPSIEVETRIFKSLTKDIEIAFLRRNTVVAAGTVAGGTAAAVGAANDKKAADAKAAYEKKAAAVKAAEEHRHNLAMEKLAAEDEKSKNKGSGDMIGTIKEFDEKIWGRNQENC